MTQVFSYTAHLKHDKGRAKLTVFATDLEAAKKMVMDYEGCPERSIEFIGRTPTKKELKRTKAWHL